MTAEPVHRGGQNVPARMSAFLRHISIMHLSWQDGAVVVGEYRPCGEGLGEAEQVGLLADARPLLANADALRRRSPAPHAARTPSRSGSCPASS
jgi:hypothetical protein